MECASDPLEDVLYIKLMYDSDEFKENLVAVLNNPKLKELEKAETMVKLMPGLKSSVTQPREGRKHLLGVWLSVLFALQVALVVKFLGPVALRAMVWVSSSISSLEKAIQ